MDDTNSEMQTLGAYRAQINAVDSQILELLNRRSNISIAIGEMKRRAGDMEVYQPQRERELLDSLITRNHALPDAVLPSHAIMAIWNEILSSSRALQQRMRVAYLGPEGTFSHMASIECLGQSIRPLPKDDFNAIFASVSNKDCDLGLLPVENSLHGSISQTFDLFMEYPVHIVGEHYSRISHCLMSKEKDLAAIQRVYSHPQPFGQCAAWLRKHLPGVPLVADESTAAAARKAVNEPGTAAIGHRGLAELQGLNILAESIEDHASNWTRFVVIAPGGADKVKAATGDSLKTSFLFTVPNTDKPGALIEVLGVLGRNNVNMSKLESRPLRGATWQYVFFVDVGCSLLDPAREDTLNQLKDLCELRILGVYPSAWRA